jgi:type II secretory ATPase GspE/PulE/Tfp pilus assembly ATPase PilB-like protein
MEQMAVSDKVQGYLRGDVTEVDSSKIEQTAKQQGMVTMLQDGVIKACLGLTTLEEVGRVI